MNSIHIIRPYKFGSVWVFDDTSKGLHQEPFVGDTNLVIDILSKNATRCTLMFSETPFPTHTAVATYEHGDEFGTWYRMDGKCFWLCPALFKYFNPAPQQIYLEVLQEPDCDNETVVRSK